MTPEITKPTLYEQVALLADKLPLAQELHLKERLFKVGLFSERVQEWIRKEAKVSSPMDSILFGILFVLMAYLPTLIFTLLVSCIFPEQKQETYPRSLFVYNNPDAQEINNILKTVKGIQENVTKLQEDAAQGGGARNIDAVLQGTQTELSKLASQI